MSLSIVRTRAALDVNIPVITIEICISNSLPGLAMMGLPETTVKEARDRVCSAVVNSGYESPTKKITINLAPANLPKEGERYDLPIVVVLLAASEQLTIHNSDIYELIDELTPTGASRGIPGAISNAAETIRVDRGIIVAKENVAEVGLIHGERYLIVDYPQAVYAFLEGRHDLDRPSSADFTPYALIDDPSNTIGQEQGKRRLELTVAGNHNLPLIGPPRTGKAMLASCLRGPLPSPSNDEVLESAVILNLVNSNTLQKQWKQRPSRLPHHSTPLAVMVGGGSTPMPDGISLVHNGILFLDELPEFERRTLGTLREPVESG